MIRVPGAITKPDGTIELGSEEGRAARYRASASGIYFRVETPRALARALEQACATAKPVRLFYGDPDTGLDSLERRDVEGTLRRTLGPLVVIGIDTAEGRFEAVHDHCLVRVKIAGRDVYRHPGYHQPELELVDAKHGDRPFEIVVKGEAIARFAMKDDRAQLISFLAGSPA